MPDPDGNPDDTARPHCIACDQRPPARHGWLICQPCLDRLITALDDIADGAPRLDTTPGSAGTPDGAARPGFGPRSPARDTVLVLTDTRGQTHDLDKPRNAQSLLRAVGWWADEARDAGLLAPLPQRVWVVDRRGAVVPARRRVEWECRALATAAADGALSSVWWFGEMLDAVEAQARHVRRALGEVATSIPLGLCPLPPRRPDVAAAWEVLVGDVGVVLAARWWQGERCGGQVRARALGWAARCGGCGRRWDTEAELRLLAVQLGDAMLDLPTIARYAGVTSLATLRSWALRDGWHRVRRGGRTVYSLADARASWWRALARRQAAAALSGAAGRPDGTGEAAS